MLGRGSILMVNHIPWFYQIPPNLMAVPIISDYKEPISVRQQNAVHHVVHQD